MSARDAYVAKMKAKLDEWNAEIGKLEARAKSMEADARLEYQDRLAALKRQREEAEADFEKLRSAGDDAWKDLKAGMEGAWSAMERAMKSAASRFD